VRRAAVLAATAAVTAHRSALCAPNRRPLSAWYSNTARRFRPLHRLHVVRGDARARNHARLHDRSPLPPSRRRRAPDPRSAGPNGALVSWGGAELSAPARAATTRRRTRR
jgi:hypothetical protein